MSGPAPRRAVRRLRGGDHRRGRRPPHGPSGGRGHAEFDGKSWAEAAAAYLDFKRPRLRPRSYRSTVSAIGLAGKIFAARHDGAAGEELLPLADCTTRASLEFLQGRLLAGAESRTGHRAPTTVNSIMGDVLAFARYCRDHDWIDRVPRLKDLDEEEVMRGRAITGEEFDRMLACVPRVVGETAAPSWRFLLRLLWESGFRISEALDFDWVDETKIHARLGGRRGEPAVVVISSTQKNGKHETIPLLPGLKALLDEVPEAERTGRVVKLAPLEYAIPGRNDEAFRPSPADLERLVRDYPNSAIADTCRVSEAAVRKWLKRHRIARRRKVVCYGQKIPHEIAREFRRRARKSPRTENYSQDAVSRVISAIGEEAGVVVRRPDPRRRIEIKYASAHDLRRSLAERLYNRGVSAETLMVVMRHADFATTRKFYQAKRRAESAAEEVERALADDGGGPFVGGLVGGTGEAAPLNAEDVSKLKALLDRL